MDPNTDAPPGVQPQKRKRGGRKPGSKNKPKPKLDGLKPLWPQIYCEAQAKAAAKAIQLLEQALAIRIGINDSDNRVMELSRLRAQLESEALAALRAAL